ncbi:MAG: GNAT family N-acetyltransferase [Anaerolineae bacterium]|jgi:CelD/BcsL family acetyltransferase involved in cellulose biosynthesis
MTLVVDLHHDAAAFDALADAWAALLKDSANDTLFLSPRYQRTWWQHLGKGDLVLLAAREEGNLLGVAPLFATNAPDGKRVLQIVGCVEVSDYLDWVTARGREEAVLAALLDFLASPKAPPWDRLDLCNIHLGSPTLDLLPQLVQEQGWDVETEVQEVCPVVNLPDTWEAYLDALDGKDRRELRRKLRRADAVDGMEWYVVGPEQELEAEVDDFLELMAQSTPEKAEFLTASRRAFFHTLAEVTLEAGWLQLSFVELRGKKLASYFNFVYNNRVLSYNSGLDWQTAPKLGAGVVLTGRLIQRAIEEGRVAYDFMRGDEQYKYRFGGKDETVHRVVVER